MAENHYIRNKGGSWRLVNPELYNVVYKWRKDETTKAWYLQMTADIILRGLDYDFVKTHESSQDECKTLDYKIERDNVQEYDGYLDLRGEYRISGKVFKSKIVDIEKLDCLFKDDEINLFDYAVDRWSVKPYSGSLEFAEYGKFTNENGDIITGEIKYESDKWGLYYHEEEDGINTSIGLNGNAAYHNTYKKYVREVKTSITMPSGGGWIQVGTDKWARNVSLTKNEDIINDIYYETPAQKRTRNIYSWSYLPDLILTNGIALREVLYHLFDECLYTFNSQFFRDEITIINEVYNTASALFHDIKLFHISDIIYVEEEGNATKMLVERGKFLKEIINYFNLELWRILDNVYLEHKSYKERLLNLDVSESEYYSDIYKYDTNIAKSEEWEHTEGSKNENFKNIKLEYSKNCPREINRAELSESFSILFADLASVISNKTLWENNDIDKATIVMVSVDSDGVINRNDTILENTVINGCLSFAYLINHIYNYDRAAKTGTVKDDIKINNKITGSGRKSEIKVPIEISDFLNINPYNYIKTKLGIALINELEYSNCECSLNYELL